MLEKTFESPLDSKEIQPVHPKGNQSWIFIGRTDAKSWFISKDPDAGKDWRQEEKEMTEDEMVGWMASPPQWTWVWASSGSWWWTGKPGMLQSMRSQKDGHNWVTELNWTDFFGRKAITNLDSILKSRSITLSTKVHTVKAMVFSVVMYRSESWTLKKAECQRIDGFEYGCWRRLLRAPWTASRSNQSILKEIKPEYS